MNVTKGPGDLPPFEPADSIWDDSEWVDEQMTALRKEWVDRMQDFLVDCMYGVYSNEQLRQKVDSMTELLKEKIEERAEASRFPPD